VGHQTALLWRDLYTKCLLQPLVKLTVQLFITFKQSTVGVFDLIKCRLSTDNWEQSVLLMSSIFQRNGYEVFKEVFGIICTGAME